MQDSQIPVKVPTPWAASAAAPYVNPVPNVSQIGVNPGRASWPDGFVPLNFTPITAGGVPPFGADANGALNAISGGLQWVEAGAGFPYDSVFSTAIGGYPKGAVIPTAGIVGQYWISLVDNNTSNPDTGGANWALYPQYIMPALAGPTVRLSANLTTAGTTVTFTADYVTVALSLGGPAFTIPAFNKSLNVGITGAGGMDTGLAPASGFVSVYAIYNPSTGASALLGTTASQTTIYGGANAPVGFTASALLTVWVTDGSRNLIAGSQIDRDFYLEVSGFTGQQPLTNGTATSATAVSLTLVPAAARAVYASFNVNETATIDISSLATFGATTGLHQVFISAQVTNVLTSVQDWIPIITPQTMYYASGDAGVQSTIQILGYRI